MIHCAIEPRFEAWRDAARQLLVGAVDPSQVHWSDTTSPDAPLGELFDGATGGTLEPERLPRVPAAFITAARFVSHHRDESRWPLLYRMLWRLTHGEPNLLQIVVDDEVHRFLAMEKSVRRDVHKMHAFVRFRRVESEAGEHFVAWHRPDHRIVPLVGPWFTRRFAVMRWTILTPHQSVSWDCNQLGFGPGVPASAAPRGDALEELWLTYYSAMFNPNRVKVAAMKKELPVRHWPTLPEAQLIDELLRDAPDRVEKMMRSARTTPRPTATDAAVFVPSKLQLPVLRAAAATCKGCELYCNATQVVFGEGPGTASAMFVGEQPGDQEDLAGRPFIGPSGKLLDRALEEAGIDRGEVYVTNAVKHFKFEQRGTRRIHAKPNAREMAACRPWLEAEIATVRPKLIVCLGATAGQSLMGPQFRITRDRGKIYTDTKWAPAVVATNHPSAVLRAPDPQAREEAYRHFVKDLTLVRDEMKRISREQANASGKRVQGTLQGDGNEDAGL